MQRKKLKEIYQNVLIIGNGFDLDLGLPTRYSDFLRSPEFTSLLDDNKLANYLNGKQKLNNWIDIEEELKSFTLQHSANINYLSDYKRLCDSLLKYIYSISYDGIDTESIAFNLLSEVKDSATTLIVDFNYTESVNYLMREYIEDKLDSAQTIDHIKIHGGIALEDIIFGVEDNAKLFKEHIFLKKSANKLFNPQDFSKPMTHCDSLVFFGHSLGATDHMYFNDYFKDAVKITDKPRVGSSKQEIVLFHYGEKNYYNLLAEIDVLTSKNIKKLKQKNTFRTIDVEERYRARKLSKATT